MPDPSPPATPAWRRLPERLLRSRLVRGAGLLMAGSVAGQGLLVVSTPFLTRLYSPGEFGVFGLFFALLTILGLIACWRYENAILAVEEESVGDVLLLCFLLGLLGGLVSLLVVLVGGERLAVMAGSPALAPLLPWLPPGLVGFGLYWPLTNWAVRRQLYWPLAWNRFLQPAAQIAIQLLLAGFGLGAVGLAIGQVLGVWISVVQMLLRLPAAERTALRTPSWGRLAALAREFRRSPLLSTPATLLNNTHRQGPVFLLGPLYGAMASGWFYLAQRTLGAPLQFVGIAVQQTYMGEAAKCRARSPQALERLFLRTSALLFFPSLAMGLVLALTGSWVFRLVFGESWVEAGRMAQILAPLLVARFVVSPVSGTLYLIERESSSLFWDALGVLALLLSFAAAWVFGLGVLASVALLSLSSTLIYIGRFLALWRLVRASGRAPA